MNDEECMFRNCINSGLNLSCLDVAAFSFAILHIMKSLASLRVSTRLCQFLKVFKHAANTKYRYFNYCLINIWHIKHKDNEEI